MADLMPTWSDEEHPTPGATPATLGCRHWGHSPGEWKYSCCACPGAPDGRDACSTYCQIGEDCLLPKGHSGACD